MNQNNAKTMILKSSQILSTLTPSLIEGGRIFANFTHEYLSLALKCRKAL